MAARGGRVRIYFDGDADGVQRESRKAEKSLDRVKKAGIAAGRGLSGPIIGGAIAAGAALVGTSKAAIEAEKSSAKLKTQLDALGFSYEAHAKQIDEVIQKHSKLAGIDDEDLQDAFTNIVRSTGSVTKSMELVGLATDLARAKNLDVAKAGEIVGKVATGNTGVLSRYGIVIKDNATASEALAQLQSRFAGQAEAYGKTTAGALDRAKVASENLGETLGAKLTPLLVKVADAATKTVTTIETNWPRISATASQVGLAVTGTFDRVKTTVSNFVAKNRSDIDSFIGAVRNVGTAVRTVIEGYVLPVFRRMAPGIKTALQGVASVVRGVIRVISGILTGDFGKAWDGVKDIFRGIPKTLGGILRASTAPLREGGKQLVGAIVRGIKAAPGAIVDAVKSLIPGPLRKVLDKAGGVAKDIVGFLNPVGDPPVAGTGGNVAGGGPRARAAAATTLQLAGTLARKFGLRITSGYRSPEHNRAVGGVPGSYHTRGTPSNPGAVDLVGSGSAMQAASAYAAQHFNLAENLIHDAGSGLHLHLGFANTAVRGTVNAVRIAASKLTRAATAKRKRRNQAEKTGMVSAGGRVKGVTGRIIGEGFVAPSDFADGFVAPDEVAVDPGPTALDFANADFAKAGLTDDVKDDLAAAQRIQAILKGDFDAAVATADPRDDVAAAQALKGINDTVKQLTEALDTTREVLEAQLEQEKVRNEELRRMNATLTSENGVIGKALSELVSGGIAGRVGLGMATPGYAGGGIRY